MFHLLIAEIYGISSVRRSVTLFTPLRAWAKRISPGVNIVTKRLYRVHVALLARKKSILSCFHAPHAFFHFRTHLHACARICTRAHACARKFLVPFWVLHACARVHTRAHAAARVRPRLAALSLVCTRATVRRPHKKCGGWRIASAKG